MHLKRVLTLMVLVAAAATLGKAGVNGSDWFNFTWWRRSSTGAAGTRPAEHVPRDAQVAECGRRPAASGL